MKRILVSALLAIAGAALAPSAVAQAYPSKPIRLVVAFPPAGPTDLVGRLIAQKLGEAWNQPVVVENVGGGAGNIATARVARSAPDGYTVLVHSSAYAVNPTLSPNPAYDPDKD